MPIKQNSKKPDNALGLFSIFTSLCCLIWVKKVLTYHGNDTHLLDQEMDCVNIVCVNNRVECHFILYNGYLV